MKIQSVNPFDLQVIKELEEFSDDRLHAALSKAEEAFQKWRTASFSTKKKLFMACADTLLSRKDELGRLITAEMGKPIQEARAEIEKCASVCNYYAENAEVFLQNEDIKTDSYKSYVRFEPLGCILAVMPWNFPFWQVFRFAAPALMAGNVGLLKHASNVPLCSMEIEKVFLQSGFPEGVFQSILVGSAKVPELIAHKVIKAVTLTGSEKAGSEVASHAGRHIKKAVLELGGSDPFIVLDDADLEKAATNAVKARMVNNGQSCIAAKRFIVHASVYDRFLELMKEKFSRLKQGDPSLEETEIGPMARPDLLKELLGKVEASTAQGAKLIAGGKKSKLGEGFIEPTILTEVKPGMPAFSEEMFGPVAVVFKFSNTEEAIELANATAFGLGASLWTSDLEKAETLVGKIASGNVFINSIVASDPRMPFGGIRMSGFGRELSNYGIKEFVNIKSVKISA